MRKLSFDDDEHSSCDRVKVFFSGRDPPPTSINLINNFLSEKSLQQAGIEE